MKSYRHDFYVARHCTSTEIKIFDLKSLPFRESSFLYIKYERFMKAVIITIDYVLKAQ